MEYIFLTVGLLVRTLQVSLKNFSLFDLLKIGGALLIGLYAVASAYDDYEPGDILEPWAALPIVYSAVVAFGFKKRLLPKITEGTLLIYGLVGMYVFYSYITTVERGASFLDLFAMMFLSIYISLAVVENFTTSSLKPQTQTVYMAFFILLSICITTWIGLSSFTAVENPWELAILGYIYLPFLANIFYILYFIPIPLSEYESFRERFNNIKFHSRDLEAAYFDIDTSLHKILWCLVLVIILIFLDLFTSMSQPLLVGLILAAGLQLTAPPATSPFTPYTIRKKL